MALISTALPGWLLKRAHEAGYDRVFTLVAPRTASSSAIYILQSHQGYELHAVDDAESGADGATIPLSRFEARNIGMDLIGFLSGRLPAQTIPPHGATLGPSEVTAEAPVAITGDTGD